jgi:hypothetical protein
LAGSTRSLSSVSTTCHNVQTQRYAKHPCSECVGCSVDRVIQRKRRDYLDPNSSSNMKKLNDDLQSIHSIMRKTIDDVLDR